jgi:hypothetical protein
MVKTQIQIPDGLYKRLKRLADEQEWSFAETLRRGAELLLATRPVPIRRMRQGGAWNRRPTPGSSRIPSPRTTGVWTPTWGPILRTLRVIDLIYRTPRLG